MAYPSACLTAPGIIAGICLSVSDIRSRTVPRAAVITGYIIQLSVFAAYAAAVTAHLCDAACFHDGHNPWERLVSAVISSFVCAGIQFALSMVRPGALGFGDTTATWLITLAVGWLGSSMVVDSPWDTWPRRVRGNEAYRTGKEGAALQQHSYKSKNRQPPLCTIYNPGCRHRYSSIRGGDPPLTAASG